MTGNKINLSSKQICAILKACKKAGVHQLSYEGLNISLHRNEGNEKAVTHPAVDQTVPTNHDNSEVAKQDELKIREMQLEELHLTDPLMYEELLLRGELEG